MFDPNETNPMTILQDLYRVINAVDISGVTMLSEVEIRLLKRTMCAKPLGGETRTSENALIYSTAAHWEGVDIPVDIKLSNTQDQVSGVLINCKYICTNKIYLSMKKDS